jgi:hypothetical protein
MGDADQTGRDLKHEYNSYHHPPCNPVWWWRRLLVFATQVNLQAHNLHAELMGDGL